MKRFCLAVCFFLLCPALWAKSPPPLPSLDQAGMLALVQRHIALSEPKVDTKNRAVLREIRATLDRARPTPSRYKTTIDELISRLTFETAQMKAPATLLVASGTLVKEQIHPRTLNLFGNALLMTGKAADAAQTFSFALTLKPKDELLRLNLASALLDADYDKGAKKLLDQLVRENPNNRSAWRALAAYYYKIGNGPMTYECLFKAAKFQGYVRRKTQAKREAVQKQESQPGDSLSQLEAKTDQLKNATPLTSADVIEDAFPDIASQIRAKKGTLTVEEQVVLPTLPIANVTTNEDYRRSLPIIEAWVAVFSERMADYVKTKPLTQKVMRASAGGEAQMQAAARSEAQKQMRESLRQMEESIAFMEKAPGVSKAQIAMARGQLAKLKKQYGVAPSKTSSLAPLGHTAPGLDGGTLFAAQNYADYTLIHTAYERRIVRYFADYRSKEASILDGYKRQVKTENDAFKSTWEKLQNEHPRHDANDIPCRREQLRHKKALNSIGLNFYKQWVNLYMPQYAQQMKPMLEEYWRICSLYIKNMQRRDVMEREYFRVKDFFFQWAVQAAGLVGTGGAFAYEGPTDEEEAELQQAIAATAEKEVPIRKPKFIQEFKTPRRNDWVDWIEDHLLFEPQMDASVGGFKVATVKLKVTAGTVEFESFVGAGLGLGGSAKWDMVNSKVETSSFVALKTPKSFTATVLGGAKFDGQVDLIRKTTTWDFENGTYQESYGGTSEFKGTLGSVSGSVKGQVDGHGKTKWSEKLTVGYKMDAVDLKTSTQWKQ